MLCFIYFNLIKMHKENDAIKLNHFTLFMLTRLVKKSTTWITTNIIVLLDKLMPDFGLN